MHDYSHQVRPLNRTVAPVWEREASDYPDLIKVPMEDGKVISYRREIEFPHPSFVKAIGNVMNMVTGYEKPADAGTPTGLQRKDCVVSIPQKRRIENG